ncbi:hypothetical protein GcM3_030027 [Golovinomyces cichoracearum]|uniref:Dna repair protein swi5 n=1 Tax=Golovinomyces cichoracearum TaxID=62708 RepID=A0A420J534_9PEZI|nr:hypothetical protein GcM3_030027 [Golovinomyces cichoracearum]
MDYESTKEAENTDTNCDDIGVKLGDHESFSECRTKDSDKEIKIDATVSDETNQETRRRTAEDRIDSCNIGSRNRVIDGERLEIGCDESVVTIAHVGDQIVTSDDYCRDHHASTAAIDTNSVTSTDDNTKTATTTCEQNSYPGSSQGSELKDLSSSLKRFPVSPQTLSKDPTCTFHEDALFICSNEASIEESTSVPPDFKTISNNSNSFESLSNQTTEQYLNTDMIDDAATFATKPNVFESANSSKNLSLQLDIENNLEVPINNLKDEVLVVSELNQTQLDSELDINMPYKFATGTPLLKGTESPKGSHNLTIAHPHPLSSQIATPTSISSSSSPLQKLTQSTTLGSAPSTRSSSTQIQDPSSSPPHISNRSSSALTQGKSIPLQFSGFSSSSSNCSHSSPTRTETTPKSQLQPKDIMLAELKSIRIASITARNTALETELANKRARLQEITRHLEAPASETVRRHIKLLHDYNDIRDIGQSLIGMIAEQRGVQIGSLYDYFGVGIKD